MKGLELIKIRCFLKNFCFSLVCNFCTYNANNKLKTLKNNRNIVVNGIKIILIIKLLRNWTRYIIAYMI